jgi:AraC-like DNA-binding protein
MTDEGPPTARLHDRFGLLTLTSGTALVWCRGETHALKPGSVLMLEPGDVRRDLHKTGYSALLLEFGGDLVRALRGSDGPRRLIASVAHCAALHDAVTQMVESVRAGDDRAEQEQRLLQLFSLLAPFWAETAPRAEPPLVERTLRALAGSPRAKLSLEELARRLGCAPSYLCRVFSEHAGVGPHTYHLQWRLLKASRLIESGRTVAKAAALTGFGDASHLRRHFRRRFAVAPSRFQKDLAGVPCDAERPPLGRARMTAVRGHLSKSRGLVEISRDSRAARTMHRPASIMQIIQPTSDEAEAGLRALASILRMGTLNAIESRLLDAVQRHILKTRFDVSRLETIEPWELARRVERPAIREQLAMAMVVLSFASGTASTRHLDAIQSYVSALGVSVRELKDLRLLVERRVASLRFDILRHMYIGDRVAALYEDEGFLGILRALGGVRGLVEQPAIAAKYRALGRLPLGTLGRGYYEYAIRNHFPFPGERGGAPEMILPHDLAHVLSGYDTDPAGEMQVAAFTAGFRREQTAAILLFVLCQFDLGVKMVPQSAPEIGTLDPDPFFAAFVRGSKMSVDLFGDWDFWPVLAERVDVLRVRYGIEPVDGEALSRKGDLRNAANG